MSDLGNKAIMARNIQYYMDQKGCSRNEICDALGIKYTTFTDWVKGNTYPRIDKIELMANYFGVSKSDLVENNKHSKTSLVLSASEELAIKKYRTLDEYGKKNVDNILDNEYDRCNKASASGIIKFEDSHPLPSPGLRAAHNDHADDPDELEKIKRDLEWLSKQ